MFVLSAVGRPVCPVSCRSSSMFVLSAVGRSVCPVSCRSSSMFVLSAVGCSVCPVGYRSSSMFVLSAVGRPVCLSCWLYVVQYVRPINTVLTFKLFTQHFQCPVGQTNCLLLEIEYCVEGR